MKLACGNQNKSGVALILVLLLMAMMVGFISMNALALSSLKREIKLIEHRQLLRAKAATNAPPILTPRHQ